MSLIRAVSIIGDSNIKHHMSSHNCDGRPLMSSAQTILCGRLAVLDSSFKSVNQDSDVCVVACITNFITGSAPSDSPPPLRAEPILRDVLKKVALFAISRPETKFMICPPMYRLSPIWYREGLPDILRKFSTVMCNRPENVFLLPSFPSPIFESDGVHLNIFSGGQYVLHLFSSIEAVVSRIPLPVPELVRLGSEATRVLEDRVMVLEQDRSRINSLFEMKSISDAELFDLQENIRNEAFFMIQGLERLPRLEPKVWQERAKADVQRIIKLLLGSDQELPISFVQNSTGRGKDSKTLYRVKMATPEASRTVRDRFGSFFSGGSDSRPEGLAGISIRNCVTPGTLARIAILQLLARRYRDSNPGSKVQVVGYEPRPLLKLTPPPDAEDKRVKVFHYVEAIAALPTNFTSVETESLLRRFSPKLFGSLKTTFGVVSDDMVKRKDSEVKSKPSKRGHPDTGSGPSAKSSK